MKISMQILGENLIPIYDLHDPETKWNVNFMMSKKMDVINYNTVRSTAAHK
jgi:hypothetical protein